MLERSPLEVGVYQGRRHHQGVDDQPESEKGEGATIVKRVGKGQGMGTCAGRGGSLI